MRIDAQHTAAAIAEAIAETGDSEIAVDVAGWGRQDLRAVFDALVTGLGASDRRLQGVRIDAASFAKLGPASDTPGSGQYAGVPVLMTDIEPDTVVLVFAPREP